MQQKGNETGQKKWGRKSEPPEKVEHPVEKKANLTDPDSQTPKVN